MEIPRRCLMCKYLNIKEHICEASDQPLEDGCYYDYEEGEV